MVEESIKEVVAKSQMMAKKNMRNECILLLSEAILESPVAELYSERAHTYLDMEVYENAITDYSKATKLAPVVPRYWFFLGQTQGLIGQRKASIKNLQYAVKLDSDFIDAHHCLCLAFLEPDFQNLSLVNQHLTKLFELAPSDARTHFCAGQYWFSQKDYKKAVSQYEQGLLEQTSDYFPIICTSLAQALKQTGEIPDLQRAVKLMTQALAVAPNPEDFCARARLHLSLGDLQSASEDITASKQFPTSDLVRKLIEHVEARLS